METSWKLCFCATADGIKRNILNKVPIHLDMCHALLQFSATKHCGPQLHKHHEENTLLEGVTMTSLQLEH